MKNFKKLIFDAILILSILITIPAFAANNAKPNVKDIGEEVNATILNGKLSAGTVPTGLLDGITANEWNTSRVAYWYTDSEYIEIQIDKDCNIWRTGTSGWAGYTQKLTIMKAMPNGEFENVTDSYSQTVTAIDNDNWEKTISNLPKGTYRFYGPKSPGRIDSEWYLESTTSTTNEETIIVNVSNLEPKIGEIFTAEVILHNGKNICAEDIKILYNTEILEYVGYEEVVGFKVYKELATDTFLRFITASNGKNYAINDDTTFLKLKFRARKSGKDSIKVLNCRIANNSTLEKDIKPEFCGEKEVIVKGISDVNRTGEFSLLDLGITAWYYGLNVQDTNTIDYDTDIVSNGFIDESDLSTIVEQILLNKNYTPNK